MGIKACSQVRFDHVEWVIKGKETAVGTAKVSGKTRKSLSKKVLAVGGGKKGGGEKRGGWDKGLF